MDFKTFNMMDLSPFGWAGWPSSSSPPAQPSLSTHRCTLPKPAPGTQDPSLDCELEGMSPDPSP